MSTPRNLENVLQQKGQVYVTKEGEEGNSARTSGGGEWADVVGGVRGTNRGGVEWLVTGADMGTICGGKISGVTRFCTEHVDLCTVKIQLISKADLKSEWLYIKTTYTRSRRKTASLAWGVPSYAFGGRGEELSCTMMSTVSPWKTLDGKMWCLEEPPTATKIPTQPSMTRFERTNWQSTLIS
jgi:hypothetical protein